jgi:hypothetical protein
LDTQGNIYELKPGQKPQPGHFRLTEEEAGVLKTLPREDRVARLNGLRDRHNQRRRKNAREAAKTAAMADSPKRGTPRARCEARNKDGQRCRWAPHEDQKMNHRAFGKEWK